MDGLTQLEDLAKGGFRYANERKCEQHGLLAWNTGCNTHTHTPHFFGCAPAFDDILCSLVQILTKCPVSISAPLQLNASPSPSTDLGLFLLKSCGPTWGFMLLGETVACSYGVFKNCFPLKFQSSCCVCFLPDPLRRQPHGVFFPP